MQACKALLLVCTDEHFVWFPKAGDPSLCFAFREKEWKTAAKVTTAKYPSSQREWLLLFLLPQLISGKAGRESNIAFVNSSYAYKVNSLLIPSTLIYYPGVFLSIHWIAFDTPVIIILTSTHTQRHNTVCCTKPEFVSCGIRRHIAQVYNFFGEPWLDLILFYILDACPPILISKRPSYLQTRKNRTRFRSRMSWIVFSFTYASTNYRLSAKLSRIIIQLKRERIKHYAWEHQEKRRISKITTFPFQRARKPVKQNFNPGVLLPFPQKIVIGNV